MPRFLASLPGALVLAVLLVAGDGAAARAPEAVRHDAAATPRPSPPRSCPGRTSARLNGDLARYAATKASSISVGVIDDTDGRQYGYQPDETYELASVVKIDILETVLWQAQQAGRRLTGGQERLADRMIRASDNDAASELWREVGYGRGVAAYNRVLGLTATTIDASGAWGLTRSSASDQLRVLSAIRPGGGPLDRTQQRFARTLMATVDEDQGWGISAGPATGVEVKNGWLPLPTRGWRVHSSGHVVDGGRSYSIVVLTADDETMKDGIAAIEGISRIVYTDLAPTISCA